MLRDVTRSLLRKPITEQYPFERSTAPQALRGKLHWTPDRCTGCALCVKDCPANAINLITIDKAAKRFVMEYHVDRCINCGQCSESCRFDSFEFASDEWELAATDRTQFTIYYGNPDDVRIALAQQAAADEPTAQVSDQPV